MSATASTDLERTIEPCRDDGVTPVRIDAGALDSTAPTYLRDLKHALHEDGYQPAELSLSVCFDEDCSLETQTTVDAVREHVRAGAFLGVGTVRVEFDAVADEAKVEPALEACAERARREGVVLEIDGPVSL